MNLRRKKMLPINLVCLYPLVSTFLMTMIWQVAQYYYKPFLGGYYFKWMHLYIVDNGDWLEGSLKAQSQVLFSVYLAAYLLLAVFTVLAVFSVKRKLIYLWAVGILWLADFGWIVWDMIHFQTVRWQHIFNLAEHLLFFAAVVLASLYCFRLKKAEPELFKVKKKKFFRKKSYTPKF
jgi:hypothetical protein